MRRFREFVLCTVLVLAATPIWAQGVAQISVAVSAKRGVRRISARRRESGAPPP